MNEHEPYVGPRPFRTDEADRFFGRDGKAHEVVDHWLAERLVVLHGPASVGKTSLLNAGVLPLLDGLDEVDPLPVGRIVHSAAEPLAVRSADHTFPLLSTWAAGGPPPAPGTRIVDFLRGRPRRVNRFGEPYTVLAAIDQFEEVFDAPPTRRAAVEPLIDQLAEALEALPSVHLLLVIRDDHVGTLTSYQNRFHPRLPVWIPLAPLTPAEAEQAVTGPVAGTGRRYADGVARRLVDDLRTSVIADRVGNTVAVLEEHVEPFYLQIACTSLWRLADGEVISAEHLRRMGDVDQVVMAYYDDVMAQVAAERNVSEARLREWLERAFITPYGTRASAYQGALTTADMPNDVVEALIERHILTPEYRARLTWYQLGQDRLVGVVRQANARWRQRRGIPAQPPPEPRAPADFRAAAEAALGEGDLVAATRYAEVAAERYAAAGDERHHAHALALKGDISRLGGDIPAAQHSFRAALATLTQLEDAYGSARLMAALAGLHMDEGRHEEAVELYRQAIRSWPDDPGILADLGRALWQSGSPADARAVLNRALDIRRDYLPALACRGQVEAELGDHARALDDLDRALALAIAAPAALSPGDEADVRSARALALAGLGRAAEADAELATAAAREPGRALTHLRSARIAADAGDAGRARREARAALAARPPLPAAFAAQAERLLESLPPADDRPRV